MRPNLFEGFAAFLLEAKPDPDSHIHTLKQQLNVDLRAFMTQPVLVPAGHKFGKYPGTQPIALYVHDFDDKSVTLGTVPRDGLSWDKRTLDRDGEMNLEPGAPREQEIIIMQRREFEKLLEPPPQPQQPGGGL